MRMFRTTPRPQLRARMNLYDDPAHDPAFFIKYLSAGERQRLLDQHTKLVYYPKPDKPGEYIEHRETDSLMAVTAIAERAVVEWENITDDAGMVVPFSITQLREWLLQGEELYLWFAGRLPQIFREFDALLDAQQAAAAKN